MAMITALIDQQFNPQDVYERIRHLPYPILLESRMKHPDLGRYSFVAADPFLVYTVIEGDTFVNDQKQPGEPLEILQGLLRQYTLDSQPNLPPFYGGAMGFFSYDFSRYLIDLPKLALKDVRTPDAMFCFYDVVFAFDHFKNTITLISSGFPELSIKNNTPRQEDRLSFFKDLLQKDPEYNSQSFQVTGELACNLNILDYLSTLERIINYTLSGEISVLNMSQRFSILFAGSPLALYHQLMEINPAPFAALMEWQDLSIVSASPERYLKIAGTLIESRPIKGTRPRGRNQKEDMTLKADLWQSTKEREELTSVADLVKKELNQAVIPGTLQMTDQFQIEQYATVWHLVASIQGQLKPGTHPLDVIKSAFPGASIAGAPKKRALEIIEKLEPVRRGIYTGAIGYLGFNGNCDTNVVIRTFVIQDGLAHIQVGGGITRDSNPIAEYQETLDKAKALFQSLGFKGEN